MAFLIGVVLAFQGAARLHQFGAQVFVVDLIAISVLRELGVLLTAIIVAGRSGAAFTAAIGSMKMREEVDALRTLGLDPVAVLALPRVMALVIALPLLTVAADVAGLIGGAAMSRIELGVTPAMFVTRMKAAIGASN
jgi:phospholipid/cholesterol/gamma-HCH transport system permease protein